MNKKDWIDLSKTLFAGIVGVLIIICVLAGFVDIAWVFENIPYVGAVFASLIGLAVLLFFGAYIREEWNFVK